MDAIIRLVRVLSIMSATACCGFWTYVIWSLWGLAGPDAALMVASWIATTAISFTMLVASHWVRLD